MSRAVPSARRIAGSFSAVLAGVALAGCSAGQITQTARQVTTVDGANGSVGPIELNDVTLGAPDGGEWAEGSSPELTFTVTTTGMEPDTLEAISSDAADSVLIQPAEPSDTASGTSPETAPTTSPASPATTPDGEAADGAGDATQVIEIPAQGLVHVPNDEVEATLDGLTESLRPTEIVPITFTFANAGSVTIEVPVANPTEVRERTEHFDFEGEGH